jgi:hypothetical protein
MPKLEREDLYPMDESNGAPDLSNDMDIYPTGIPFPPGTLLYSNPAAMYNGIYNGTPSTSHYHQNGPFFIHPTADHQIVESQLNGAPKIPKRRPEFIDSQVGPSGMIPTGPPTYLVPTPNHTPEKPWCNGMPAQMPNDFLCRFNRLFGIPLLQITTTVHQ